MTEMTRSFDLLTQETRVDVVFDESIDTRKPIVSSDQFEGSGGTAVASERGVMVLAEHVHTQGFQNVDEALI